MKLEALILQNQNNNKEVNDNAKKDIFKQYNFQYKKSLPSKK
jgi:hypothetical protein